MPRDAEKQYYNFFTHGILIQIRELVYIRQVLQLLMSSNSLQFVFSISYLISSLLV